MFSLKSNYKPTGDQPEAIKQLVESINKGNRYQTLQGVTGSGKTFTIANVINKIQKPTLVIAHNKTLAAQLAQDGMPAVTSDPNGRPGIAVPNTDAPTELRISTLTKGDGAVVAEGQTVVAHYTGVLWGGSVFDSTWDKDRPANLLAQDFTTNNGQGVVPGFAKAFIGQTIGSRLLVAIPPSEGYPAGQAPTSIPADATMIFVIDILGTR